MHTYQTHFLTLGHEIVDCLLDGLCHRTHCDNHVLGLGITIVVEQTVFATCDFAYFIEVFFYDCRHSLIILVAGLTVLEENIGVLGHAACHRGIGIEGTLAELGEGVSVNQCSEGVLVDCLDFLNLVRCAEAVEEVDEGHSALYCGEMGHTCEVHHFLY